MQAASLQPRRLCSFDRPWGTTSFITQLPINPLIFLATHITTSWFTCLHTCLSGSLPSWCMCTLFVQKKVRLINAKCRRGLYMVKITADY